MAKIADLVRKATDDFKKAQSLAPGISKIEANIERMRKTSEILKRVKTVK